MPRVRLGVVIVVPEPVATEIDGLRRGLGDPARDRIVPHVTLVPPLNVRSDDVGDALAVLRAAAACAGSLRLDLGAPRTFGPDSPTLYLPVSGDADDLDGLLRIRHAAFTPPLHRTVDHDFVPHVTVAMELPTPRLAAAVESLADYRRSFVADAVTLLRYEPAPPPSTAPSPGRGPGAGNEPRDGVSAPLGPRWVPIADVRLGPPAVVGRGGIELVLTAGSILDPEALRLLEGADRLSGAIEWFARPDVVGVPPGSRVVVVTARQRGATVGVGWGHRWTDGDDVGHGEVADVVATRGVTREGVERQVELALASLIASG